MYQCVCAASYVVSLMCGISECMWFISLVFHYPCLHVLKVLFNRNVSCYKIQIFVPMGPSKASKKGSPKLDFAEGGVKKQL